MALKDTLETLEGLPETVAGFYEEQEGGGFVVSQAAKDAGIETEETLKPLKEAKNHEQELRRQEKEKFEGQLGELTEKLNAFEAEREQQATEQHRKSGDWESMEKSLNEKHEKVLGERDGKIEHLMGIVEKSMVTDKAWALTHELAVDNGAKGLYPHINDRLALSWDDAGEPKLVVWCADGKPTVNTLDDLKAEFLNDDSLAHMVKGSSASGSGAGDGNQLPGGGAPKNDKPLNQLSIAERNERALARN